MAVFCTAPFKRSQCIYKLALRNLIISLLQIRKYLLLCNDRSMWVGWALSFQQDSDQCIFLCGYSWLDSQYICKRLGSSPHILNLMGISMWRRLALANILSDSWKLYYDFFSKINADMVNIRAVLLIKKVIYFQTALFSGGVNSKC